MITKDDVLNPIRPMLYVALIDYQSVAINVLIMNLMTLCLWPGLTKGNWSFA